MQPGTKYRVGMLSLEMRGKREEIREQICKRSYLRHRNACQGLRLTIETSDGGNIYGLPIVSHLLLEWADPEREHNLTRLHCRIDAYII